MCKLSIIVPVYCCEDSLDKCILSILNQSLKNFEIILVNDGSTDSSPFICEKYKKIDNRVQVIHSSNQGQAAARNKGIDIAKGKYIGFVDSDDWIHPNMYEILLNEVTNSNSEIGICKTIWTNNLEEKINILEQYNKIKLSSEEALKELIKGEKYMDTVWDKIYKAEIWKDIRFPEGVIHEDTAVVYKLLGKSSSTVYIDVPLYYYYQRPGSTVNRSINERSLYQLEALKDMKIYIEENYSNLKDEVNWLYLATAFNWFRKIEKINNIEKEVYYNKLNKYVKYNKENILSNSYLTVVQKILLLIFLSNKMLFSKVYSKIY